MPQLMPLFWGVSGLFMFLVLYLLVLLFSLNLIKFNLGLFMEDKKVLDWCW